MVLLKRQFLTVILLAAFLLCVACSPPAGREEVGKGWPSLTQENKPWSRWWWHGSALTKEGITSEMEAYHAAGIGGLEITPIYGVYGQEAQFVQYLSPEWMELLKHVLSEAARLDMGIDMATGTGWPFGGPWVGSEDACKNLQHKVYEVKGGSRVEEKIQFVQQPYLRALGTRVADGITVKAFDNVKIADLVDPVIANKNLQALAIEQVQFEKPLALKYLMAYGDDQQVIDLTAKVDVSGNLDWTAPSGQWKLYAVFEGFHGKMVERAGPGGEGNVIDHFSGSALKDYLDHFDNAFKGHDIAQLRSFFNDSYEVDDARGAADFTPALFDEFMTRRGYDLRMQLPALFGHDDEERNRRVLCDYRETISELLLDNFTKPWKQWANNHGALVRNQAHGSPANILDLYATVDIPEIEGMEPLRFKMASSSGNVSGKRLISAEAATWLNEHFMSNLSDIRNALDLFMLHGVNHLVYHGTCYSPPEEPWPGRLFYAAVHLNPRNPMWKDFAELNSYVTGCQSFLQKALPDNDVLLYYPVYDRFSTPGPELIEHFDGINAFQGTSFYRCAEQMLAEGFSFDYISDKQIRETEVENGLLKTSGGSSYKVLAIPQMRYMPLETLEKISTLAASGATVMFIDKGPRAVSGFGDLDLRQKRFDDILQNLSEKVQQRTDLALALADAGLRRESMVNDGIQGIRKKSPDGGWIYFIKNANEARYEGWLPLSVMVDGVLLFDPMSGVSGKARIRKVSSGTEVYIRLEAGQSLILESYSTPIEVPDFPYPQIAGTQIALAGTWKISFESGGPALPPSYESKSPSYWTDIQQPQYKDFSGTAVYELTFARPAAPSRRSLLTLESVKESAEVILNGTSLGSLIGPVFQVEFDNTLLKDTNVLQIKVSNLMANRIAYMDRNKILWKKFYNVNFPSRLRENSKDNVFTAAHWETRPSGLKGKVELFPLK